jgi:uncharacterized protein
VASYRAGNYTDAFKEWTEAAQQGDVDAQYNLGCLYVRGEGVPQNGAWAIDWLQRAADQGDVDAATWLLFSSLITDDRRKQFFSRRLKLTDRFRLTFVVQLSDGRIHRRPCSTDEKDGAQIEFSLGGHDMLEHSGRQLHSAPNFEHVDDFGGSAIPMR